MASCCLEVTALLFRCILRRILPKALPHHTVRDAQCPATAPGQEAPGADSAFKDKSYLLIMLQLLPAQLEMQLERDQVTSGPHGYYSTM